MAELEDIRMLALDVDGTLAARGDEVTTRTRDALHRATAGGIDVVLATGRRYRSTQRVIDVLELSVRCVVLGGALVKERDGTTLDRARFPAEDFDALRGLVLDAGLTVVCQRDSSAGGGPDFVVDASAEWNPSTERFFDRQGHFGAVQDLSGSESPEDAVALGVYGQEADVRRLREKVAVAHGERFLDSAVPIRDEGDWYFELLPNGTSKWSALQALAAREGLSRDAICAVGDEVNDLSMIRGAGIGVAMGNAREDVKSAADFTTGHCEEDGVVDVVDRILAARRGPTEGAD